MLFTIYVTLSLINVGGYVLHPSPWWWWLGVMTPGKNWVCNFIPYSAKQISALALLPHASSLPVS